MQCKVMSPDSLKSTFAHLRMMHMQRSACSCHICPDNRPQCQQSVSEMEEPCERVKEREEAVTAERQVQPQQHPLPHPYPPPIKLHKCLPSDLQMCHFLSQQKQKEQDSCSWCERDGTRGRRKRQGQWQKVRQTAVNMLDWQLDLFRMRIAVVIGNRLIDF